MILTSETSTRRPATLLDLDNLPEDLFGEIIDGELQVHPRPDEPHARVAFKLTLTLGNPFDLGVNGPGGWIFLPEPRILFGAQTTLSPDLAGWRRERYAAPRKGPLQVTPDWICEILSPSTARYDRVRKLPIYAQNGVSHAWVIDPVLRTLDVLRLESGSWVIVGIYERNDKVRAEPFGEIEIDLSQVWGPSSDDEETEDAG